MATVVIPSILGHATLPDGSGDVFQEPYSVKATNGTWDQFVWVFKKTTTRIGLRGLFRIPQSYVGSPVIIVEWTSTATSGDVEWDFDYRAVGGDDAESMDQATAQESVNQNDTAPTSAHNRLNARLSLTAGNFAAGDLVEFELFRDGTDAGNTMAAAALVFDVAFEFSDT